MKHVLPYALFEASATAALTAKQIGWLDKCVKRKWKLNPQTGLVDVVGSFYCSEQGLTDLKGVKFGDVSGDFVCYNNRLTTLGGAPQTVGAGFYCDDNELTSLEGAPQTVGGSFNCYDNRLTTLEGAPQTVGWSFNCRNNELTSLVGAPQSVDGDFNCRHNHLTSLEGAPQTVGRNFNCADNSVTKTTLYSIFALMEKGMAYQQALEEYWPEMGDEDRVLMYKQMTNLPPEETRKYNALATYANIKDYL